MARTMHGLFLLAFVFECLCQQSAPMESPCPSIFQYVLDPNGVLYGKILVYRWVDNVIQLNVEISVGNNVNGYNGNIELAYSRAKAVEDIVNRRPLHYNLYFPIYRGPYPKVTKILINGEQVCSGPPIDIKTVPVLTTVNLQHRLKINMSPNLGIDTDDSHFDVPFNRYPFRDNHNPNNNNNNNNGLIQPNIDFNPQPPKNPTKNYPTVEFINVQTLPTEPTREFYPTKPTNLIPGTTKRPVPTSRIGVEEVLGDVCGKPLVTNPLVANGRPAARGFYPWLVAIYTIKNLGLEFSCGGNLISAKHIVTAAHCMHINERKLNVDKVLLILGKYNIQRWTNGDDALMVNAFEITVHSDYKKMSADADIAVITVEKEIQFTKFIKPICLWTERNELRLVVGEKGIVVGWGKDENGALVSAVPKEVAMPIVSQVECITSDDRFQDLTSERTFCAGYRNGSGPCNGDSGGGLIILRSGRWTLRGLVSMSLSDMTRNCDLNQYIIFTDVSKFTDWLLTFIRQ